MLAVVRWKEYMAEGNADGYPGWLKELHSESHGNSDLVAHFFAELTRCSVTGGVLA